MSLKAFHVLFIVASVALCLLFGGWSFREYAGTHRTADLVAGMGSVAVGLGLVVYGRRILRKLRHISYL